MLSVSANAEVQQQDLTPSRYLLNYEPFVDNHDEDADDEEY